MKIDKLDNTQWCDILNIFFETCFKDLPINVRKDNNEGIYINTIYGDISETIIKTFKEELDIHHYAYKTKYGIEAIHIKNLPQEIFLNDEIECKCINTFSQKFIDIRNKINKNYIEYFNNHKCHNLYKFYILNREKKFNYTYLYNYVSTIKDVKNFHIQMKEYDSKYKLLMSILNNHNSTYSQAYNNRKEILVLENYFNSFWENKSII